MHTDINDMLIEARKASKKLLSLSEEKTNQILTDTAQALEDNTEAILRANAADLRRMDPADPKYDRLRLTEERISGIASDMRNVSTLPSPRRVIDKRVRPNGLEIERVAVPFGVIGIIYEARPNVTPDVFSLCFKSGNACVLKGGHDAADTNTAIVEIIHHVLDSHGIDKHVLTLLPPTREATDQMLQAHGLVDLIIPRGSASLIQTVRQRSLVPVIETGAGVCHCYIDRTADIEMATKIVTNAKTRRVSVCNALDCIICHCALLPQLPEIVGKMAEKGVIIHADGRAYAAIEGAYPATLLKQATEADFGTEFLSYALAIKTVDSIGEAIAHIDTYGSGHSESIVTGDEHDAQLFLQEVDAACVYVNAPTSFTDGAQFGLGAEIGISTQKLHARGPMALAELMTYKWLIRGEGQTRP